jgi:RNA polymerase sigma factor (sigma-70 family)
MSGDLRPIRLFLASPGGVPAEREIARDVVVRLNGLVARKLGFAIDLNVWEDAPPAYGRPQSLINPHVEACDVFVGLLYRRWGTATGDYTSGFHEEYDRAVARRRRGDTVPEVMLFFKDVDSESLEDPGPQLQRVLAFRQEVEASAEVLFGTFADEREWKDKLGDALTAHMTDLRTAEADHTIEEPASAQPVQSLLDDLRARYSSGSRVVQVSVPDKERRDLAAAVNALDGQTKTVLVLRYFEGISVEDIAITLGLSVGKVGSILEKALRDLGEELARG